MEDFSRQHISDVTFKSDFLIITRYFHTIAYVQMNKGNSYNYDYLSELESINTVKVYDNTQLNFSRIQISKARSICKKNLLQEF